MDSDLTGVLDELEQLSENAKKAFGKCIIDEEQFFLAITRLKMEIPNSFKKMASETTGSLHSLFFIDELENLVETSSKLPLSKYATVDPQQYLSLLAQLKEALDNDIKKAAEFAATRPADSETTIDAARAEAERIIQDAYTEAERILAEARQHAAQLGSGPSMTLPDSFPDTPNRL